MRRGFSNPTRPSLLGHLRDPDLATRDDSPSVIPVPTAPVPPPLTARHGKCSRRDTLHATMRPLVTLPELPTFSEFLKGMSSATSELNMVTRMGSTAKVADFVTVAKWFAEQDLAHVPTPAARQTTFLEPRSKPAVDSNVSAATRLRTSVLRARVGSR